MFCFTIDGLDKRDGLHDGSKAMLGALAETFRCPGKGHFNNHTHRMFRRLSEPLRHAGSCLLRSSSAQNLVLEALAILHGEHHSNSERLARKQTWSAFVK